MLLPQGNQYVSGEVTLFDKLVRAGEERSSITLPHRLHAFLVGCLLEYLRDISLLEKVLALDFLQARAGLNETGLLKRTGDEALLIAGLFPRRARSMNVSASYISGMGESAYLGLADKLLLAGKKEPALFYGEVGIRFRLLAEVLNGTREGPRTAWDLFQQFRANAVI